MTSAPEAALPRHGGSVCSKIRWRRRLAVVPGHQRHRRSSPSSRPSPPPARRHQPSGHLGTAASDREGACAPGPTSPSSTATNTAPPSSSSPALIAHSDRRQEDRRRAHRRLRRRCRRQRDHPPLLARARATLSAAATAPLSGDATEGVQPPQGPGRGDSRPSTAPSGCPQGRGVSIASLHGSILEPSDIETMADDAIVFALANPREVDPIGAGKYAAVVATGRRLRTRLTTSWRSQILAGSSTPRSRRSPPRSCVAQTPSRHLRGRTQPVYIIWRLRPSPPLSQAYAAPCVICRPWTSQFSLIWV